MLEAIATATTDTVVLNREDPRVAKIAEKLIGATKAAFFGLSNDLRSTFPSDDEIHSITPSAVASTTPTLVSLEAFTDHDASFKIKGQIFTSANLKLQGIYNIFNAAAALSLIAAIQGDEIEPEKLTAALSDITPAFGRGEKLQIAGQPLELVLVKNPGGFRLGLKSFPPENYATMIAINDNYADGRDLSWLWDVDFESLRDQGVAEVTGIRAYDMALRLQYDEIAVSHITTDLTRSLKHFIDANKNKPKRIYCTYTAMLALRRELSRITEVEVIS
jgi:UDP-N-acetylmuramyl tripeptide synthase